MEKLKVNYHYVAGDSFFLLIAGNLTHTAHEWMRCQFEETGLSGPLSSLHLRQNVPDRDMRKFCYLNYEKY